MKLSGSQLDGFNAALREGNDAKALTELQAASERAEEKPGSLERAGYVAMLECSCGNESVGDMWVEAHVCTAETTIAELMQWKGKHLNGKRLSIAKAT